MSAEPSPPRPTEPLPPLDALLEAGDRRACCAVVYEHPAVRWLLGYAVFAARR